MHTRTLLLTILLSGCFLSSVAGQTASPIQAETGLSAQALFDKTSALPPRDLYRIAHEAFRAGDLEGARLLCLRIFLDGFRSTSLLDLLGNIELKANRPLLAAEWLRKALCLNQDDEVARRILVRLPPPPRPIPVDAAKVQDHFNTISAKLPMLLGRLNNPKLHADSVYNELARGQFYKALALAEEYEKRYPGVDGQSLTALTALFLGRSKDAASLVQQGLKKAPYHPTLLFVKALLSDTHPETGAPNRPRALYDLDRWDEAMTAGDQHTQFFPRSAEGMLVKARIHLDRLELAEAQKVLVAAGNRDPGHPLLDLLTVDYLLQRNQVSQAAEVLERAFRCGYNLPSVSLRAGLLAVVNNRIQDAVTILEDARNSMPFLDRDAYPAYIQLAMSLNKWPEARSALDQWAARFPRQSAAFYLEGLYALNSGDQGNALNWIKQGMARNPDSLVLLRTLAAIPAVLADATLGSKIAARLARSGVKLGAAGVGGPPAAGELPVAARPAAPAAVAAPPVAAPPAPVPVAKPAAPTPVPTPPGSPFQITAAPDLDPSFAESLAQNLEMSVGRVEPFLGPLGGPIQVQLVSASGRGSRVAEYDEKTDVLTVSALFFDQGTLQTMVEAEQPQLLEHELNSLSQWLPQHLIDREISRIILLRRIPQAREKMADMLWMHFGLAEVVGGAESVLRHQLVSTQARIASGQVKLSGPAEVNKLLGAAHPTPAQVDTAMAQAYLMTAFLVKKGATMKDGINLFVQAMEAMAGGRTLDRALQDSFKTNEAAFDAGWKEAAFFSLKQGIPYEW